MTSKQNEAFQSDPSMDEILASIRSIISDDVKQTTRSTSVSVKSSINNNEDVLELTEMIKEDGSVVSIQRGEGMSQEPARTSLQTSNISRNRPDYRVSAVATPEKTVSVEFISREAVSESMQALQGLDTLSNEALQEVGRAFSGSKPLEVLMIDVLRPMLKEWIDANLPSLVKVIVNEQVEKVMQARRGKPVSKSTAVK